MTVHLKKPGQSMRVSSIWTGLPFKMVWISALAGLTVSIIITVIQVSNEIKLERNNIETHVAQIIRAVSGAAADAAYEVDAGKAQIIADGIFSFSAVNYVKIDMDIGGVLIEKTTISVAEDYTPMTRFIFGNKSDHDHNTVLTVPGYPKSVGNLYVQLDLNAVTGKFIAGLWNDLFYIIIGVTIFSGMIGVLFYYLLAKPLIFASTELGELLNNMDDNTRITVPKFHRNDELGALLTSINAVITARKELNNKLQNQQRALDEHAIVSTTDISGRITSVNKKFIQISGYTKKELLGKTHRVVKSDEHSEEFYADLWKTISSGKPWTGEIRNLRKDFTSYWVKATIYPFLNDVGKIYQGSVYETYASMVCSF